MGNWYKIILQKDNKTISANVDLIGFTKDGYCMIFRLNEKTLTIPRQNIVQIKRLKSQGRQR